MRKMHQNTSGVRAPHGPAEGGPAGGRRMRSSDLVAAMGAYF